MSMSIYLFYFLKTPKKYFEVNVWAISNQEIEEMTKKLWETFNFKGVLKSGSCCGDEFPIFLYCISSIKK